MLQAAAQRGVRVNVIVYKEVPEALTCMYILVASATHAPLTDQCARLIPSIIWKPSTPILPCSVTRITFPVATSSSLP